MASRGKPWQAVASCGATKTALLPCRARRLSQHRVLHCPHRQQRNATVVQPRALQLEPHPLHARVPRRPRLRAGRDPPSVLRLEEDAARAAGRAAGRAACWQQRLIDSAEELGEATLRLELGQRR